jgi:hypothetical protein
MNRVLRVRFESAREKGKAEKGRQGRAPERQRKVSPVKCLTAHAGKYRKH